MPMVDGAYLHPDEYARLKPLLEAEGRVPHLVTRRPERFNDRDVILPAPTTGAEGIQPAVVQPPKDESDYLDDDDIKPSNAGYDDAVAELMATLVEPAAQPEPAPVAPKPATKPPVKRRAVSRRKVAPRAR